MQIKKLVWVPLFFGVMAAGMMTCAQTFHPRPFISIDQEADKLRMECAEGTAELTFYTDKIVHFAYYPTFSNRTLPGWGIRPAEAMVSVELKKAQGPLYLFSSASVHVAVNTLTGGLQFQSADGTPFLETADLTMQPAVVQGEKTYKTTVSFVAPDDEHYFGLGQHQSGWLDHRGLTVPMWQDYDSEDGEVVAVPFMLTNKKYAFVYDNPSKTTVACGVDGQTVWESEMGEAVSYYIIYGESAEEIYKNYGLLCGVAPLPPKKSLGYIQCKQKYKTQEEVLKVARKHKAKGYPIDYMIVDWFHWDKLGDLDLSLERWPDAAAMNAELKAMDINCMISCWPRFTSESKNFDILNKNGWLMRKKDGSTVNGAAWDNRGAVIDNTNPDAAAWYWNTVKKNYVSKGFDSFWLDESEPDVVPHSFYLHAGLGARVYNIYPYCHAKGMYDGHRKDLKDRVFILTRSAYLGTHQFGTAFWSSDIYPEWDVLERQIACGVNFCASGLPYWSSDIGGWQKFQKDRIAPAVDLLIESDQGPRGMYPDYPEMYVRWFQYGAFCPTFRAHGTRSENEVWSYGPQVEEILVDYLNLRYHLMPYIYSQAWNATANNTPVMRGLFVDYMSDEKVLNIKDEYLFGPSLLVAPVVHPGQSSRTVYLPKGSDWYDFWTNKKFPGGSSVTASAPIETLPLYVKAGTILPKANGLKQANQKLQSLDLFIYPGADGEFVLYDDNGTDYDYETGQFATIQFSWNDAEKTLTIGARQGGFDGMTDQINLNLIVVTGKKSTYINESAPRGKQVVYGGQKMSMELK